MADGREVDPDLVRAACGRHHLHQAPVGCRFQDSKNRLRLPPLSAPHAHSLPLPLMPPNGQGDPPLSGPDRTVDQGQVRLLHLARLKLPGQVLMGHFRLGHHQAPRGLLVEPVNDPGSLDPPDPGEPGAVVEKGVHERPTPTPCAGMDHEA